MSLFISFEFLPTNDIKISDKINKINHIHDLPEKRATRPLDGNREANHVEAVGGALSWLASTDRQ